MSEQQLDIQNHCCAASIPLGFQSSHRLSLLFTQVLVIDFHVWGTRQKRYRVGNELSLINVINVELYNYQRICVCVSQFWVRKFDNQRTTHFGNVFRWVATAKKITPTQALKARSAWLPGPNLRGLHLLSATGFSGLRAFYDLWLYNLFVVVVWICLSTPRLRQEIMDSKFQPQSRLAKLTLLLLTSF